ncbi:MAG TPA: CdaR family protein [Candidatus Eisenbacteria bacterium]|nr:CdaR family protein [Candidatus Eisenbacteria bacterium]
MRFVSGLMENMGVKITALLLAIALYFHVVTEQPQEKVLGFPLVVQGLADSLALQTPPPTTIGVKVRGTGKQILRLSIVRPKVVLDLSGVNVGQFQRTMTAADFQGVTSEGVDVTGPSNPPRIELTIEPRAEVDVPVAVRTHGDPALGFFVQGDPQITPDRVRISGPRSWVRARDSVETEPLSIAGKRKDVEAVLPLETPPAWATVSPGSVEVTVPIGSETGGSTDLAVQVVGLRPDFKAGRPDPGTVHVSWGPSRQASTDPGRDLVAVVDAGHRGRGRFKLKVELRGPGAGHITKVKPDSVALVIP